MARDNNVRLAIGCALISGVAIFVVAFYFLFRLLTYPGF